MNEFDTIFEEEVRKFEELKSSTIDMIIEKNLSTKMTRTYLEMLVFLAPKSKIQKLRYYLEDFFFLGVLGGTCVLLFGVLIISIFQLFI